MEKNKKGLECFPGDNGLKDLLFRWNYISRKPIYDFFVEKLSGQQGTILDFGCGKMPYKKIFKCADSYIGLDVESAKEFGFHPDGVIYYDGKDIPLDDESVDCVVSCQVFEHVPDLNYSMNEIYRVLKKEGTFCFSVPMAQAIHMDPYDFRRFTIYGIEQALNKYNYKNIEIVGTNRPIDSIRWIRALHMRTPFRQLYTTFSNLCFLNAMKKDKRISVRIENLVRKLLHKSMRPDEFSRFPIDYLVICKK